MYVNWEEPLGGISPLFVTIVPTKVHLMVVEHQRSEVTMFGSQLAARVHPCQLPESI